MATATRPRANMSTATTGGVHPRDIVNKYLWFVLIFVIVIVIAFGINHEIESGKKAASGHPVATIPLASAPQSSWPKLALKKGETSARIPLPNGMHHIVVAGNNYLLYTVYADGSQCSSFGKVTCHDGAVMEYFVKNEAEGPDILSYAFVPKQRV